MSGDRSPAIASLTTSRDDFLTWRAHAVKLGKPCACAACEDVDRALAQIAARGYVPPTGPAWRTLYDGPCEMHGRRLVLSVWENESGSGYYLDIVEDGEQTSMLSFKSWADAAAKARESFTSPSRVPEALR